MAKVKTRYVCKNCGAVSATWLGKCPVCGAWNSYVEETIEPKVSKKIKFKPSERPVSIAEISSDKKIRFKTAFSELDRILGGGLVEGSLVLLAGEPGIGKSTLALQLLTNISAKSLYISGEESLEQIKLRALRLNFAGNNILFLNETNLEKILDIIEAEKPKIVVIDSIQTLYTDELEALSGSISQIRQTANKIQSFAKQNGITFILIGHITKEGLIAGPKVLEHIVDVVLYFAGDRNYLYRILRTTKNRFGPTEIALFEMTSVGLQQILNPSEIFLSTHNQNISGISIAAILEGLRPILIEVQALVSSPVYGTPQRIASGYDVKKLNMLLAVIEKRMGLKINQKDVFLNIAGGLKILDPAVDLPVLMAVLSSNFDIPLPKNIAFAGEISLSGEIKPVFRIEQRIAEVEKLGFSEIWIPKFSKLINLKPKIKINFVHNVKDLLKYFFE